MKFTLAQDSTARLHQVNSICVCLEYILDSEFDDFAENPSENHVYFQAFVALGGLQYAKLMLKDALKGLK